LLISLCYRNSKNRWWITKTFWIKRLRRCWIHRWEHETSCCT
jgi:hypothetical protein